MKPSPLSPMLLALLLAPWVWGPAAGRMLRSCCDTAPAAQGFLQEQQKIKPGSEFPWILTYVPIRSCHSVLKDKYGEFSLPVYHGDTPVNFWCNWTIWAGSRKHIIIYIQGFISNEGCNKNEDKILFEGVSSLVENSVVYACWKKEMHVFATFAQAVHVVLLKRYLPNCRETQFKGKYYVFQDQKGEASSKDDVISKTSATKLQKQASIFQSGWAEDLRDVLGFGMTRSTVSLGKTRVLSSGLLREGGSTQGTMTVGSPVVLGSELRGDLRCCKEPQGRATPGGIVPTGVQDTWGQSFSVSGDITVGFGYMHRLSNVLLETPLLGALQVVEPFLQPAGVGLENRQSVLHPTSRLKDLGDPQFTIKPTHTSSLDLVMHLQSLSLDRRESNKSTNITMYRGLSTVSLEKGESHLQLSVLADDTVSGDADGLAKSLMPSLSSLYEVVKRDHSHLLPERSQRYQSSFGDLPMTPPELRTSGLQHTKLMGISSPECFWGVLKGKTVLHPTAPWDILQENPQLCGQSGHIQHLAPADPGSLPPDAQAHDGLDTEKTLASSLNVKSCHHQSDRATQLRLVIPPFPTGLKHLPTARSTLGTEATPTLVVSCTEPVPADFSSTDFTPEALRPPEVGPMSRVVFSSPSALDLDPVSLRKRASISPASPGDQFVVSPSPPHHPSVAPELGTDESPGQLGPGLKKLVLGEVGGQQGQTSASVGSVARGVFPASAAGPKPGVGLPQPEDNVSSGSGVVPASLPSTWQAGREEYVVPVRYQGMATGDKLTSASILRGFKTQKTTEALQAGVGEQINASSSTVHAHPGPPVAQQGGTALKDQKPQEPSDPVSRNTQMPGGQQQKHAELGPPWAMEYFPISSCHLLFRDGSGMFYLPLHTDIKTNIWCNWTIWAGPQKHIVIYVQGFQGSEGCGKNQDKIIFQGVLSSVETKVVYACHNQGTLIFATQATAVHVLFLSGDGSQSHEYRHFKGWYYVFRDSETVASSDNSMALQESDQEVSKKESWRTATAKGLLPILRTSPSPAGVLAGGRIQPELVSPDEATQHSSSLMEDAQSGANLSECDQLCDETELERSLKDGGSEGREAKDDMLVEPSPAGKSAGCKDEMSVLETAKEDVELVSALVTVAPCSSEVPSSNVGLPSKSSSLDQDRKNLSEEVVAAACCMQTPVLEEPPLNTNTESSPLYPSPGVTTGDVASPGERNEELFDLVSALASPENDSMLQSRHHPGDVLFEVAVEIKPKDWILHGGSELRKDFLESMKTHIQENLKLSANRVNEIKLKEIKRMHDANLLLTFWLHLKPEERNVSLLLHSQLEELLGTLMGVEKLQLVSLFVEDINECSAGVGFCGEEAECFNDVGTYLCRCKKDYEDRSPNKSGTLCIPAPRSGIGFFRHADILVGAAIMAGLAMLVVAAAILCKAARRRWHPRRNPSPEEPPVRAVEEPAMELHDLGECLRLDPFQLKLRARPPEWLWAARAHPGQAYRVFLEQSSPI